MDIKDHNRKGFLAYHSDKITKLIDDGKINVAKKLTQDLLKEYPDDEILNVQLSRINIIERDYATALFILEQLEEQNVFLKIVSLCIELNQEDKLYYLYKKYFCNKKYREMYKNDKKYRLLDIYLNKRFNPDYKLDTSRLTYYEKQIYSYSRELAIRHIKNGHLFSKNREKAIFVDSVNIEELYDRVDEYVKNNPNEGYLTQTMTNSLYFYEPGIGKKPDSGLYDCLHVCVMAGTKEILTMFPVSKRKYTDYLYLEKKDKGNKKIRVKSGLERFNERYNK